MHLGQRCKERLVVENIRSNAVGGPFRCLRMRRQDYLFVLIFVTALMSRRNDDRQLKKLAGSQILLLTDGVLWCLYLNRLPNVTADSH